MPSQSPSLPSDSVQACLHGRECVHFRPTGEYCNRTKFRTRFNFVYFVLLAGSTKFSSIRKPCTYTSVSDTTVAVTKISSVRKLANARVRNFYAYENFCDYSMWFYTYSSMLCPQRVKRGWGKRGDLTWHSAVKHQSPAAKATNSNCCDRAAAHVKLHVPEQSGWKKSKYRGNIRKRNKINTKTNWK